MVKIVRICVGGQEQDVSTVVWRLGTMQEVKPNAAHNRIEWGRQATKNGIKGGGCKRHTKNRK